MSHFQCRMQIALYQLLFLNIISAARKDANLKCLQSSSPSLQYFELKVYDWCQMTGVNIYCKTVVVVFSWTSIVLYNPQNWAFVCCKLVSSWRHRRRHCNEVLTYRINHAIKLILVTSPVLLDLLLQLSSTDIEEIVKQRQIEYNQVATIQWLMSKMKTLLDCHNMMSWLECSNFNFAWWLVPPQLHWWHSSHYNNFAVTIKRSSSTRKANCVFNEIIFWTVRVFR